MLLVISGLPGTGKSTVAAAAARRLDATHLSVDTVEDALLGAGLDPSWRTGVAAYEAVRAAAEQNLLLGRSVVVDAVNDSEPARDTWRRAAARTGAPAAFVLLVLDDVAEHRRRLEGRSRPLDHVSEPAWDDVRRRADTYAPWPEAVIVDAARGVDEVTGGILAIVGSAR